MAKKRLDVMLVEQGLAESREKAKAIIMSSVCMSLQDGVAPEELITS